MKYTKQYTAVIPRKGLGTSLRRKVRELICNEMMEEQSYRWIYDTEENALLIWEEKNAIYIYLKISGAKKHVSCFKNICVVRDTDFNYSFTTDFDICIDFMGHSAGKALQVHRNAFNEKQFSPQKHIRKGIFVYIKAMLSLENREVKHEDGEKESISEKVHKKVYENLYQSNIPWIRLLYLEPNMSIKDGLKKIDVINIKVDSQPGEDGSELVEIKETYDKRDVAELLHKVKKILSGEKEEELFVISPDKRIYSVQNLGNKLFYNLCEAISKNVENVATRSFPKQKKIIERMMEGITVINDNQVYDLLSECTLLTKKDYHIEVDKIDKTITVFLKKEETNLGNALDDEGKKRGFKLCVKASLLERKSSRMKSFLCHSMPYRMKIRKKHTLP